MNASKLFMITLYLIVSFASCTKQDDSVLPSNQISDLVSTGNWKITLYNDSGKDDIYHFTGFVFTFNNGTVIVKRNSEVIYGTYHTGIDDSSQKLYLDFGNVAPLQELNDDWKIMEMTAAKIRLQDISSGNGGTDLLTFERI